METLPPSAMTPRPPIVTTGAAPGFREFLLKTVILYRITQCGEKIPFLTRDTDYAFIQTELEKLAGENFISAANDELVYRPTQKAHDFLAELAKTYDLMLRFRLLSRVRVGLRVPDSFGVNEYGLIPPDRYDPRFPDGPLEHLFLSDPELAPVIPTCPPENLVIGCMLWLAETQGVNLNPSVLVLLQLMIEGLLRREAGSVWLDLKLGVTERQINEATAHFYNWRDLAPDDPVLASQQMNTFYNAALDELDRRSGRHCTGCFISLAHAERETPLSACPNGACNASFIPPTPPRIPAGTTALGEPAFECPHCGHGIRQRHRYCRGCHAAIDWRLPEGLVLEQPQRLYYEEVVWVEEYRTVPMFSDYLLLALIF